MSKVFPVLLAVGGCRSGKSRLAMEWALRQEGPRAFIATSDPGGDPEMLARVKRHQVERGPDWHTFFAPLDPAAALREAAASCRVAVLDCVTIWLSNLMARHKPGRGEDEPVLEAVRHLAELLRCPPLPVALVSNETGMGIVPETPVGRHFRDLQGEANQILAAVCPNVVFSLCGLPLVLKGNDEIFPEDSAASARLQVKIKA